MMAFFTLLIQQFIEHDFRLNLLFFITFTAASLKVKRGLFVPHQNIDCGNVHSLTTFTYQDITFLVAGDMVRVVGFYQELTRLRDLCTISLFAEKM